MADAWFALGILFPATCQDWSRPIRVPLLKLADMGSQIEVGSLPTQMSSYPYYYAFLIHFLSIRGCHTVFVWNLNRSEHGTSSGVKKILMPFKMLGLKIVR